MVGQSGGGGWVGAADFYVVRRLDGLTSHRVLRAHGSYDIASPLPRDLAFAADRPAEILYIEHPNYEVGRDLADLAHNYREDWVRPYGYGGYSMLVRRFVRK